jgi:hypothetical protein
MPGFFAPLRMTGENAQALGMTGLIFMTEAMKMVYRCG